MDPTLCLVSESLELSLHTILYSRQLYPSSIFSPTTFLGLQIHVCRHDKINKYIADTVRVAAEGIIGGDVDCVVLTFVDEEANRFASLQTSQSIQGTETTMTTSTSTVRGEFQNGILERFVFDFDSSLLREHVNQNNNNNNNKNNKNKFPPKSLSSSFRNLLLRLTTTPPRTYPGSTTFRLGVQLADVTREEVEKNEVLCEALGGVEWYEEEKRNIYVERDRGIMKPIKSVVSRDEGISLEVYVEKVI